MFGGQDANAAVPQTGASAPQDDALKGITDLVGGSAAAATTSPADNGQSGTFLPAPADAAPQVGAPTLPGSTAAVLPTTAASTTEAGDDDLLDLKQQALQQLTPLVDHLEQSPLEKFRTTMMLIQASDNQTLLKEAYEAAQKIEDDKTRAQALLDVVNEINYFTQPRE